MRFLLLISLFLFASCKTGGKTGKVSTKPDEEPTADTQLLNLALPPVFIYKTKNDYTDKVPVGLSEDKTSIVSFPDPSDLRNSVNGPRPYLLCGGYLLDNRGIGPLSAFLDITYEDYSRLTSVPTPDELLRHIADADPFTELYVYIGQRDTALLNVLIRDGPDKHFRRLK